jgi:hypothetical protein
MLLFDGGVNGRLVRSFVFVPGHGMRLPRIHYWLLQEASELSKSLIRDCRKLCRRSVDMVMYGPENPIDSGNI